MMRKAKTLIPVEGHTDLYRDPLSGAIIKTNQEEYDTYIKASKARREQAKKLESLQDDVSMLKSDLSDIKSLLTQLLHKENTND